MQILADLEPTRRDIYAGAIGYIDFMESRFLHRDPDDHDSQRRATVQAGAGIVADSNPAVRNEGQGALLRRSRWRKPDCDPAHRQLRLVHLEPGPVPRRAGRAAARPPQRRADVDEIERLKPSRIVISPGPGRPEDAGISVATIRHIGMNTPLLGVCLGHQGIGIAFGGSVVRADELMHGKVSAVHHDGRGVFQAVAALRSRAYHSLVIADRPG